MQEVIETRGIRLRPEAVGGIATLNCADLGKLYYIEYEEHDFGPYQVVDCAQRTHVSGLRERQWVVDVPYELAQELGMRGPIRVKLKDRPDRE